MPPVNPVFVSAGVIAISVAVVAAIAVYENPELRRIADDLRRRIAVAAQTFHDDIFNDGNDERERQRDEQAGEQPVFNRPEDAEGFMMSTGRRSGGDPGVDADEASRRRQREELMYWNTVREAKAKADREIAQLNAEALARNNNNLRSNISFDQFLRQDHNAVRGTYVMNTGTDASTSNSNDPLNGGLVRRRGAGSMRVPAVYSNPFGDEYGIEMDDHLETSEPVREEEARTPTAAEAFDSRSAYLVAPDRDETMSDIYSATEPDTNMNNMDAVFDPLPSIPETAQARPQAATSNVGTTSEVFFDVNDYTSPPTVADHDDDLSLRLERIISDAVDNEDSNVMPSAHNINAVQAQVYDTIQAWAEAQAEAQSNEEESRTSSMANSRDLPNSGPSFYSPLPVTPSVVMSEPSIIDGSDSSEAGELTPTGSVFGDDHSVIDHADAVRTPSRAGSVTGSATGSATSTTSTTESAVLLEQAPAAPTTPLQQSSADANFGVLSESEDEDNDVSVMTPTSWSEVGSVVSENEEPPMRS
ncbi:hypothetical protein SBRCBS47491_002752 [Sporothrix bragantina]|uniref:Uncharacterized protein n=1 Tax=Sporothrix bragantina TaxID=671064 RepID=A0ABP0B9J0_9PEZI